MKKLWLFIFIVALGHARAQLSIVKTIGLPAGATSQAYSATVVATGGTPPYTWSVSSGSLPAGLTLGSGTGTISGTPSGSRRSTFTVHVHAGPPATADWTSTQIYIEGATHTMYTLPLVGNSFSFVPPAASSLPTLCKFAGPMITDLSAPSAPGHPWTTIIPDKYPNKAAWATQAVDFLTNTGWNACGFGSKDCESNVPANWPDEGTFFTMELILREDKPWHVKALYGPQIASQVCGGRYYIPGGIAGGGAQCL
jgi:hypothetical protein